eukprot:CFRG4008T1
MNMSSSTQLNLGFPVPPPSHSEKWKGWKDRYCNDYGLRVSSVHAPTGLPETVVCRFCENFGRETHDSDKKRKRTKPQTWTKCKNSNVFTTHNNTSHKNGFREYRSLSLAGKVAFFPSDGNPSTTHMMGTQGHQAHVTVRNTGTAPPFNFSNAAPGLDTSGHQLIVNRASGGEEYCLSAPGDLSSTSTTNAAIRDQVLMSSNTHAHASNSTSHGNRSANNAGPSSDDKGIKMKTGASGAALVELLDTFMYATSQLENYKGENTMKRCMLEKVMRKAQRDLEEATE